MLHSQSEIALSPFFNWFVNGCSDVWSSPNYFKQNNKFLLPKNAYFQYDVSGLFVYGARNCVIVCQLHGPFIRYAFNITGFESIHEKVSCLSFARCLQKPKLFIGSNLGNSLIYQFDENKIQCFDDTKPFHKRFDNMVSSSDWANNHIVFYSIDTRIVQWNFEKGSCSVEFESPSGYRKINSIVVTKIEPLMIAIAFSGGQILIIKLEELELVNYTKFAVLNLGPADICSLAFPYDNGLFEHGLIAAISRDGDLKVWELDSRKELFSHQFETKSTKSKAKNFFSIVFIPAKPKSSESDSDPQSTFKLLLSKYNGDICVVDVPSINKGTPVKNIQKISSYGRFTHSNVVFNISVVNPFHYKSDDKTRSIQPFWDLPQFAVSISLDRSAILWDLTCLKAKSSFPTLNHQVHDLEFNPYDNNQLAIATGDGLKIWRFSHQRRTQKDTKHSYPSYYRVSNIQKNLPANTKIVCLAWHPQQTSGENVIAVGTDDGEIFCIDLASSTLIYASKHGNVPRARIYSAKWGPIPDNHRADNKSVWGVYSVYQTGHVKVHVPIMNKVFDFDTLSPDLIHYSHKTECVWRNDFNYLAIGCSNGSVAICLNDGDLKPIIMFQNLHTESVSCIRWHPDYIRHYDEFNEIKFQDKTKFESWIATGSCDCTIQIIDLDPLIKKYNRETPSEIIHASKSNHILHGHTNRIISLSWSTCVDEFLASCSADTTVQVWQAELGIPLYNFRGHWSRIFCLTWAPWSEDLIFSAGDDNTVQAWLASAQKSNLPPDNGNKILGPNRVSSPQLCQNETLEEECDYEKLVDPLLADDQPFDIDSSAEVLTSSPPSFKALLKSITGENESNSSGSTSSPNASVSNLKQDQKNEQEQVTERQSADRSSIIRPTILSKLKNPSKSLNEYTIKEKKKSLLPLSNITENCSTKLQTIQDIEYLIGRKFTAPQTINDAEVRQRCLLFLDKDDVKDLVDKEIHNHVENKNFSLAYQVSALKGDLKATIIEASKAKQLNDWLVAMSASISREFWSRTALLYAVQLENSNESAQAALYYSSVHRITDAVRVLLKAGLYKESLILVKNCASFDSQLIRDILNAWAKNKESQDNLEFAAKIYVANLEPDEAVRCLAARKDDPKCQSLSRVLLSSKPLVIKPN